MFDTSRRPMHQECQFFPPVVTFIQLWANACARYTKHFCGKENHEKHTHLPLCSKTSCVDTGQGSRVHTKQFIDQFVLLHKAAYVLTGPLAAYRPLLHYVKRCHKTDLPPTGNKHLFTASAQNKLFPRHLIYRNAFVGFQTQCL